MLKNSLLCFCLFVVFWGCAVTGKSQQATQNEVNIKVVNTFGAAKLQLNQPYKTLHGEMVEFTRYVYYLSNIHLKKKDGSIWKQPQSYHILEIEEDGTADFSISLKGMPEGDYSEISFSIGVDSVMNHSGDQPGVLNPDYGMFWMWETGYVFLKCEGFFQKPKNERGALVLHIGRDNCYRRVRLPLSKGQVVVKKGMKSELTILADARQLFGGFPGASIQLKLTQPNAPTSVMGGNNAPKVADNYARMFSLRRPK